MSSISRQGVNIARKLLTLPTIHLSQLPALAYFIRRWVHAAAEPVQGGGGLDFGSSSFAFATARQVSACHAEAFGVGGFGVCFRRPMSDVGISVFQYFSLSASPPPISELRAPLLHFRLCL